MRGLTQMLAGGVRPRQVALAEVAQVVADATGVWFLDGLERALEHGLREAAAALGEDPMVLARRVVARAPDALAALLDHAVVGETRFWRHAEALAAVGRFAARRSGPLAVWSAGCASGEEPYSVAIALLEAGRAESGDRVVATDISERSLAAARAGRYGARALRHLPAALAERWLEPDADGDGGRARPALRARVSFVRHNLVTERPPAGGPFDVVLCRNVLMYFEPAAAAAALYRLVSALRPGGALVLGPVELPLASGIELEWVEDGGATLLLRPA